MANRTSLYTSIGVAPFAWAAVLLFTRFVAPQSIAAYIIFFALLTVALVCTFTPVAYVVSYRFLASRLARVTMRYSLRQGILLSLVVVLNLILHAFHSWSILMAIVILGAAVVIEILALARK